MLDRIWSLMHIGIEIIFVFDGEGRPDVKRDKKTEDSTGRKAREENSGFFKETLTKLHIPWRQAPGEAEAECAALQRLGLVDAVWLEDSDTLMFGCTVLVKNLLKSNGQKSKDEAKVYRLRDIEQKTRITANGIVLYAMVAGCDYTKGLHGCGTAVGQELAKKKILVEEFSKTLANAGERSWNLWRRRLEAQLSNLSSKLRPHFDKDKANISQFPNFQALGYCRNPKVSSDNELRNLDCMRGDWYKRYSTESLRTTIPYMRDRFHYNKPSKWWFRHLAPVALNQRLLALEPGARDLVNNVTQKRSKVTSIVDIDPRQIFPGIEEARCPQGMLVLNGFPTGKEADRAVVEKRLEIVQSVILDAVLGWGMSDEEFLEWRKGPEKASAGNGKPAAKKSALPKVQTRQRGRKRKAENSARVTPLPKRPATSNPPAKFKLYDDNFVDLIGDSSSQEIGSGAVPSGALGAASKPLNIADKSTPLKPTHRVREESVSFPSPRNRNELSVSRETRLTQEDGVSEVLKTLRKHYSAANSARHPLSGNVGSAPVLSSLAKQKELQGKGGSIENPINLDD
ncbi:hypothetical protein K456DRAFT_32333 [Colletotrichum gloeosporioides 23]|nr:hypothetical protein K456DRAFT_32333 [Colletotrichum gloeosporioides 23]